MLKVKNIVKQYEGQALLNGLSFMVDRDETVCLLGPSGGGKSTILRIVAGLEKADGGSVSWGGKNISNTPAHLREFGLMFQDYALFPHLNVHANVAFGLRQRGKPDEKVDSRVDEVLAMVNMGSFKERSVIDLSGGEKQRVAFARAIAPEPRMLMLDEPMGSLDRALRDQLITELCELLRITDIPVIYVTHDLEEAFSIADRILILHEGGIVQSGTPAAVYAHPQNLWVASFFGFNNRLRGEVISTEPLIVQTKVSNLLVSNDEGSYELNAQVDLVIMAAAFVTDKDHNVNLVSGKVIESQFMGKSYHSKIRMEDGSVFIFSSDEEVIIDEQVTVSIDPASIICFPVSE